MKRTLTTVTAAALLVLSACAGNEGQDSADAATGDSGIVQPAPIEPSCSGGRVWCGESCEDLRTSLGNCGFCNLHCATLMACRAGTCVDP